jgi:transposase InsO family protein/transposase-like protein
MFVFSYKERIKAVELLIKYDMAYSDVRKQLGYPSKNSLRSWYKEYMENGDLHSKYTKKNTYSEAEKTNAVNYYLEHGKSISRTVKKLGYPCRPVLSKWIDEIAPNEKKHCFTGGTVIKYSHNKKEKAVISLCSRNKAASEVAKELKISRSSLYKWKSQLLKKDYSSIMRDKKTKTFSKHNSIKVEPTDLSNEKKELEQQVADLKKEVHRLKIERDIYEKAAELLKKEQGINIKFLTNREKAMVINALRDSYQLKELLEIINMAKSSYCYQNISIKFDKYADLRVKVKEIFDESKSTYGYRRIHSVLKSLGVVISEKVVRMIMKEDGLIVPYIKKKRYNSYKGEISPEVENIVNRDFYADKINSKWLTDITEFHIPAGKVYLSPIIDCFDGLPVSWTIGTSPNAKLVNTMLDSAVATLTETEKPIVHSDRGCHYRWPDWIKKMESAGLTRSMSKKGCSPDNAACEGFFGRLKNEMFYAKSWVDVSIESFIMKLDQYLRWYGEKRIKLSLGGMSPIDYRKSLGLIN